MGNGWLVVGPATHSLTRKKTMPLPCITRAPEFHPPFSQLSDDDLDTMELIALSVLAGVPMNYNSIQLVIDGTACYRQMTPRQRREMEIWWVLYLTNCTTDAAMRAVLRNINSKTTLDERRAALTALRVVVWDYAECADI